MTQTRREAALSVRPGDIVRLTTTLRVTGLPEPDEEFGRGYVRFDAEDVQSGVGFDTSVGGTDQLEIVLKARKLRRQDFRVGDRIDGDQLREVMWRRGTIVERQDGNRQKYILLPEGRWAWLDSVGTWEADLMQFDFAQFTNEYVIRFLPL